MKNLWPTKDQIKNHKGLQFVAKYLHAEDLWHVNRQSMAKGFAIGLFMAFVPLPIQMILAVLVGLVLRANLIAATAITWVSNPVTIPFIFYFAYKVGQWILGWEHFTTYTTFNVSTVHGIVWPLLLGCLICGLIVAFLGYVITILVWRKK